MRRATWQSKNGVEDLKFQSTLSMRRATDNVVASPLSDVISIHALHEESDSRCAKVADCVTISIHALHEESDPFRCEITEIPMISIHALHEESDRRCRKRSANPRHFNPRSP